MWIHKRFFMYASGILLILLIVFLAGKIDYFFWPFQKIITAVFFSMVISGLLYYLMRPLVRFFSKYMNKTAGILLAFLVFIGIGYLFFLITSTTVSSQIQQLSEQFPKKVERISDQSKDMSGQVFGNDSIKVIEKKVNDYSQSVYHIIEKNLLYILSIITNIAAILAVVPFIVFYLLRDDEKIRPKLLNYLPENHVEEGNRILLDIDKTLSTYIVGQLLIAVSDGIFLYIGFLIIGLNNSLILALLAMVMMVVPFIGPIIGIVPAVLMALLQSPFMVLKVILAALAAQQLDGNLVTPKVMGSRLDLHPLTVIFLLVFAGSVYGFIGILIAIPLYSIVKVTLKNLIKFYKLRKLDIY
ncbi:AI-2E family transporter [Neobacillus sp. SM06]|uniref:AI-2E family transporter n=1 Tax=Neobacillus sp. SM06 TaxID=3422492 RepID=UPI003D2A2770